MADEKVVDVRFLCCVPDLDLVNVIAAEDDILSYSEEVQSFLDKAAGFVTFLNDHANYRNADAFISGVSVLGKVLKKIGCTSAVVRQIQLESAVRNRNTTARGELVRVLSDDIRDLSIKLADIPLIERTADTISGSIAAANKAELERRKEILVVDDSMLSLHMVEKALENWFTVYTLADPEDYKSILSQNMVDLIILDVEMPKLDGYQLMEAIRAMPAYYDTPFMLLTGHATPENLGLAKSMKVKTFIRKPFDEDVLVKRVCEVIADAKPKVFSAQKRAAVL